ncbi:ModD protein [Oharaeibacter diazotrophicus]|uniref:Putative pyrophosphorylase ModD n=1 Tax=Oharaeibacter diazotrophicus TaxID=1920512 RepID=A0A4R6RAJ2_9HYPH|nr:ModD protein [Oharaeibacter diazotrophicus]TDP83113.1 molybdenum transport protein [Oharaeibacter diazotrophicus]BBE71943.1 putative nicotinate-nucleotide pyrophosphorylase [carboxylating] [Pleomorphomonas sp. SM30]GLS78707.1 ModD protein [Oharaeibacter diazotrophicus]
MNRITIAEVERLLAEDVPAGDLTTDALAIGAMPGRLTFAARGPTTVAGIEVAGQILGHVGATVALAVASGTTVPAGTPLLVADGQAGALHRGWKVAQTLVEVLSGIAGAARSLVDAAAAVDPAVRVACTRKTVPGTRRLSQIAVVAGGAVLHRHGLSETVLLFAEHRAFLAGEDLAALAARLRHGAPEKRLVVEVGEPGEARRAIAAGFDVIQLEKFKPDEVAAVAAARPAHVLLAAAGGIDPSNAAAYVRAGAGLLVTSWPYTARPAEVAVTIVPADRAETVPQTAPPSVSILT